jgi:hypothetical protein
MGGIGGMVSIPHNEGEVITTGVYLLKLASFL